MILSVLILMAAIPVAVALLPSSRLTAGEASPGTEESDACLDLYNELNLNGTVHYDAFAEAVAGYGLIRDRSKDVLVVIDYTKPSSEKRMCVINMAEKKVLFQTYVAHGRNSGLKYATSFSNTPGSHQSSLGFYVTENTYQGRNGYSLILHGIEKGINDRARERAIVIHGAEYCNPDIISSSGRLGRSHGCPALPTEVNKPVIDSIKEGAVVYIYAGDEEYLHRSPILSQRHEQSLAQDRNTLSAM